MGTFKKHNMVYVFLIQSSLLNLKVTWNINADVFIGKSR